MLADEDYETLTFTFALAPSEDSDAPPFLDKAAGYADRAQVRVRADVVRAGSPRGGLSGADREDSTSSARRRPSSATRRRAPSSSNPCTSTCAARPSCSRRWMRTGACGTRTTSARRRLPDPAGATTGSATLSDDPYTIRPGETREPPRGLLARLRNLGPGIVVSGSIVGSGEILLTAGLGAAAGFVLLWWVLFSCWIKSLIQAELARYVVTTGDTYLRALNRLPGKLRFFNKERVAWPIWLGLVGFVPGILIGGGIIGGAGQALGLLLGPVVPAMTETWATVSAAALVMLILGTGAYMRLEKAMLVLVMSFTAATIVSALLMQTTEFRATGTDILSGLTFDFPLEHAVLALAMYGATGVASGEIAAYTYWCVEKGYPTFVGGDRNDPGWVERARGWVRVVQTDVWVTLVILTFATLSFFFLGAGVLHRIGELPSGSETIAVLSRMYTQTLGPWSFWLFSFGAFCILFSTSLSGIGAGSRSFPDLPRHPRLHPAEQPRAAAQVDRRIRRRDAHHQRRALPLVPAADRARHLRGDVRRFHAAPAELPDVLPAETTDGPAGPARVPGCAGRWRRSSSCRRSCRCSSSGTSCSRNRRRAAPFDPFADPSQTCAGGHDDRRRDRIRDRLQSPLPPARRGRAQGGPALRADAARAGPRLRPRPAPLLRDRAADARRPRHLRHRRGQGLRDRPRGDAEARLPHPARRARPRLQPEVGGRRVEAGPALPARDPQAGRGGDVRNARWKAGCKTAATGRPARRQHGPTEGAPRPRGDRGPLQHLRAVPLPRPGGEGPARTPGPAGHGAFS